MSFKVTNIRMELGSRKRFFPPSWPPASASIMAISRIGESCARAWTPVATTTSILFIPRRLTSPRRTLVASRPPGLPDLEPYVPDRFDWPEPGSRPLMHRPVVIGSGPAGLIAGYALAQCGYRPLILERGKSVKDRVADVRVFDHNGPLDPESNYLFGEGGAGTFSDGKLTSRNTGPDVTRVLEILAECHGKPSIVYEQRPHLGSNRLPLVVRTLRRSSSNSGARSSFRAASRISTSRTAGFAGSRPHRVISPPTWRFSLSATVPETRTTCCCAGRADSGQAVSTGSSDRATPGGDRSRGGMADARATRHSSDGL